MMIEKKFKLHTQARIQAVSLNRTEIVQMDKQISGSRNHKNEGISDSRNRRKA